MRGREEEDDDGHEDVGSGWSRFLSFSFFLSVHVCTRVYRVDTNFTLFFLSLHLTETPLHVPLPLPHHLTSLSSTYLFTPGRGQPLRGHKKWVTSLCFEPLHADPTCSRMASSSKDHTVSRDGRLYPESKPSTACGSLVNGLFES